MFETLILAVFTLAFGAMGGAVALSSVLMRRSGHVKAFKTFLFFAYLSGLFFLAGLRGGLGLFLGPQKPWVELIFDLIERAALASVIYYLPATVNSIMERPWSRRRLAGILISAGVYFAAGLFSLPAGRGLIPGLPAVAAFLLIILFVLADALRSLPMMTDGSVRMALFFLYGLTFLFLPAVQLLPLFMDGLDRFLFLGACVYYFALAVTANVVLAAALIRADDSAGDDERRFLEGCRTLGLSPRESEIASAVAKGATYKEIAWELGISPNTVSSHLAAIYRKTGTRSKVEMVNAVRGC